LLFWGKIEAWGRQKPVALAIIFAVLAIVLARL
jgi:hypothetical protein